MEAYVKPHLAQKWTHRHLGGEFEVAVVNGDHIKLVRTDRLGMTMRMHEAQLNEHYAPLDG